jgi:hypothetical protein
MRVASAAQILAQRVFHIRGIADQKGKYAHAIKHHAGQHDQENAGQAAGLVGHDRLRAIQDNGSSFDHPTADVG